MSAIYPFHNHFRKVFAAMPENKSKYTVFLDRTGATAANQDLELCQSIAGIFQVDHLVSFFYMSSEQFPREIVSDCDLSEWFGFLWYVEHCSVVFGSRHSTKSLSCHDSSGSASIY